MPDNKGLAHLRINAAGYGLNALFDIEDDVARAAAQSNHDAIIDLAQQVAGDEADITALQAKDAEIDATILQIDARDDDQDTQLNVLQNKTQLYSVVGGVNVNHPILKIGDGLEVNDNVLNVTGGGGGGGDISALTARVEALEDNDEVQDGEISALQTNVNTLSTVQTSQGNAITALQSSDASQNSDIADIKAALQSADLANMSSRLTAVEAKNAQQDTDIDNLQTAVTTVSGRYSALKTRMTTAESNINALETNDGVQDTDIDNLQADMTTAQGDISGLKTRMTTAESDINALETNDGVQDTDIDNLQTDMTTAQGDISGLKTRMTTAENDIDALEANDLRFSVEKTGLYTSSGDTNTYFTDLLLGPGLAVTNGILDVVGGGGGSAGYDVTGISNANSAADGFSYPLANATNFPPAVKLGTSHEASSPYPETLLLTTTWPTGQSTGPDGKMQVCIYKDNVYTRQRHYTSNPSAADYPYYWTAWSPSAYSKAVAVNNANSVPLVSGLYTKGTGTLSNWPTGSGTGVLFQQLLMTDAEITSSTAGQVAAVQTFTQADKIWVRSGTAVYDEFFGSSVRYGTWAEISGGGGSTGPTKIAAGTDLDTITTEGEYYFNGGRMTNMPTWPGMVAPSSGEGNTPYFMTVRKRPYGGDSGTTYLIEQEIIATDNAVSAFITSTKNTIRHISRVQINGGSWSSWVSQDTAMTCADCNLACRTGKYWINSNSDNRPSGMGTGVTGVMDVTYEYGGSTDYTVIQKITTASAIYVRNNTTSAASQQGTWNAWKSITLS